MFTGTGSLVYEIETSDVYENFYKNKNLFDFSDYPQDSMFFDLVDNKVIGKKKDEIKWKVISESVGLKSTMYSLIVAGSEEFIRTYNVWKISLSSFDDKRY